MQRRTFLSGSLKYIAVGAIPCSAGCGTIFHSERNYQPHSRDIDWKVAALDGLGLLFFFIPGVVAFIVDFHTGAIYLPPEYLPYEPHDNFAPPPEYVPPAHMQPLINEPLSSARSPSPHRVAIAPEVLHPEGIQAAVAKQLGKPIDLDQPTARVSELDRLENFEATRQQCQTNPRFGTAVGQFFRERVWRRGQSA